ncbi:MAG: type II toxin-antitoxin system Phd/YefM family antitoxin [Gemmatimonadetes bacterium]|nr:type II toxin-antitoxin system Phd/YefM family antitoxin [Gemmatimonadota bacterium]
MATHSDNLTNVRTIKASEFKTKCLKLMDEVADSGVEIVITKNGRPVSRLVPYRDEEPTMFGRDRDRIRILGDIISPLEFDWDEERELALIQGKNPDKP